MFTVLFGLFAMIMEPVLYGLTFSILWGWFVIPTFHLPPLSIPVALGITLLGGMLHSPIERPKRDKLIEEKKYVQVFLADLITPLLYLFFGWIFHQFM